MIALRAPTRHAVGAATPTVTAAPEATSSQKDRAVAEQHNRQLIAISGCGGAAEEAGPAPTPSSVASKPASLHPDPLIGGFRSSRTVSRPPLPVLITIGGIDLPDAPVDPLGLNADGTIAVPRDASRTCWFQGGLRPGEQGAAVILGHVDSRRGPAVFYHLRQLQRGDEVVVSRVDHTTVTFVVDSVRRFAKARFPATEVYSPTMAPELRLITCGGAYVRSAGGYQDNVIVFAHLKG